MRAQRMTGRNKLAPLEALVSTALVESLTDVIEGWEVRKENLKPLSFQYKLGLDAPSSFRKLVEHPLGLVTFGEIAGALVSVVTSEAR